MSVKTFLSLDFGQENVKLLATEREGDTLVCRNAAVVPVQGQGVDELVASLRKVLGEWTFQRQSVRVALPENTITVRFIEVPNVTKAQLLTNVGYESSKYIPFPLKDMYFDCEIFPPRAGAKDGKATAVIAAVKRESVSDLARILHGAGIAAELLDVGPTAVFNAFELFKPQEDAAAACAILDVGAQKSHLGILLDGVPAFFRELDMGEKMFSSEAKSVGQLSVHALAGEVHKSIGFLESQKGISVQVLFLTGGGALLSGGADALQQSVGLPVRVWNPFESPKIRLEDPVKEYQNRGSQFVVALGLAGRDGV